MPFFWTWVDRLWLKLASVKLTLVVFVALLLLSIPGTVFLQFNISNVDPGLQYDYNFWRFGSFLQLFSAYHSFWYAGLIGLLAMNLISCSVERWPQMWRLARARPVRWAKETFHTQNSEFFSQWRSSKKASALKEELLLALQSRGAKVQLLEDSPQSFQVFWQTGQWSRIANYLVHSSLLLVFLGAIISALYGFEGAANIPAGQAVDSFLIFKEGKASGLVPAPGGLGNERLLGFRLKAESFDVKFYPDYPGRAQDFVSHLGVYRPDKTSPEFKLQAEQTIRVNSPFAFENFVFYQASYGPLGDFDVRARLVSKKDPSAQQIYLRTKMGEVQEVPELGGISLVPIRGSLNVQNLGPGVQFQEFKASQPVGEPFWVLKDYPFFDLDRRPQSSYGVILDDLKEMFFTGLQIGYDPGAPIYWLGTLGMLIGTFWALFVTHKKYYLNFDQGEILFTASTHRLPLNFSARFKKWSDFLRSHS